MTQTRLLGPWRRRFQWLSTLIILLTPWFRLEGKSLLRVDIPELSLYFFGLVLRIEELYLMLFACLILVFGFLLVTLVFGRVWCGWACPQTTLNDIAEWLARTLKLTTRQNRLQGPPWRRSVIQLCYAGLAFLVAANLLWYFIEPSEFFRSLLALDLHFATWMTLSIVSLTIYIDLAFIRRLMCSEFCPYGRIQTSLVDPGTLTLHLPQSEKPRCIECGSCVRACPTGIDIRQGYQVECINCGRCLDACRQVMARRNEPGLIGYSFGTEGHGPAALLNPRTLLVSMATFSLTVILCIAIFSRADATLKIAHSHLVAERRLASGETATFFNAWVNNRSQEDRVYFVRAEESITGEPYILKGQTEQIAVKAGANRRIDFVLTSAPSDGDRQIEFTLKDRQGRTVATATALIKATSHD